MSDTQNSLSEVIGYLEIGYQSVAVVSLEFASEQEREIAQLREQLRLSGNVSETRLTAIRGLEAEIAQLREQLAAADNNCITLAYRAIEFSKERDELRERLARFEWRPIETAPECTHVLARNDLGYVGRAIRIKDKWEHIGKPSHWMPLPEVTP